MTTLYSTTLDIKVTVKGLGTLTSVAHRLEQLIREEIQRLSLGKVVILSYVIRNEVVRRELALCIAFENKGDATMFKMAFRHDLLDISSENLHITIDEITWLYE